MISLTTVSPPTPESNTPIGSCVFILPPTGLAPRLSFLSSGAVSAAAVFCLHSIFHGQQSFGIFRGNTKKTRKPTPQNGTGTSQCDSSGDTHDITCSDGCCQCCSQGSKLTHVAGSIFISAYRKLDGCPQMALREAEAYCEVNMSAEEQYNHGPSPKQAAEVGKKIVECFHKTIL